MTDTERLSPLDASFLHMENDASPMHVGCVMLFDGPPPPYEQLLAHLAARLHLVPRYRKRLAFVPLNQGRPRWVDDEDFDLRFHVRRTALPAPGSDNELRVLAGRVFSQALRRDRPLWEIWLVEGVSDGRFALLSKTHHALVDGVAGVDILSVLFGAGDASHGATEWEPQPAPSPRALLLESLVERATIPAEGWRTLHSAARGPRRLAEANLARLRGVSALASAGLSPAPATPFNSRLAGPDRRFAWARMPLADAKRVKDSLGGTVNDVILTTVSGALRRYLIRRGSSVEDVALKVLVPVSVRSVDERGEAGNKVSGMIAPLPVSVEDPVAALQTVSDAMRRVKSSGQAVGAQAITELSGFAPANLISQAARVRLPQRLINLVVTNVPGPQYALSMAGCELLDIFPLVPLGSNLTLAVAIVSYNGTLDFGLVGDFKAMDDLDDLAGDLAASAAALLQAAGKQSPHRRRSRPAKAPQ